MTTRGTLYTRVADWVRRPQSVDPTFFTMLDTMLINLEARIAREIVHSSQETVTTLSVTGRSGVLPADCLYVKSLTISAGTYRKLERVTPEVLRESTPWDGSGDPRQYSIQGRSVYLAPAASATTPAVLDLTYYARFAALTDAAQTNYLLTNFFDLYLYGMLAEAGRYLQDRELMLSHDAKYVDTKRTLLEQDGDYQTSGGGSRRVGSEYLV